MEVFYRTEYTGEFVVHVISKSKGVAEEKREWIPNTINERHTGHAVVFGNGISRLRNEVHFDLFRHHKGGLQATKKITTYGCNALHRDAEPHFLVVNNSIIANEIIKSGYADNNIVVTNIKNIMLWPDKFHLIPFNKGWCAGATALYLAAFDGHNKVYFLGFDGQDTVDFNNNVYAGTNGYAAATAHVDSTRWEEQCKQVFDTYVGIEFVRVMPNDGSSMPEIWKYCNNLRQIGWRQFVSEIDLGVT